jgi:hypothetical protein
MANALVKADLRGIERKLGNANLQQAKLAVKNQMLMDMERFVPKREADLRASGHVTPRGIEYSTLYARAQFYGTNGYVTFRHYSTPGTNKRWDKVAKAKYSKTWQNVYIKALMGG